VTRGARIRMWFPAEECTIVIRSAKISECGRYRYSLSRMWEPSKGVVLFCMLNPSTADGMKDDPTIRKCIGFAQRWDFGGLWVVNLFAFRATDPQELKRAQKLGVDIIGPKNSDALTEAAQGADRVVLAWGAHAVSWKPYAEKVTTLFREARPEFTPWCLGVSGEGLPRHPLMLAYSTPMEAVTQCST